MKNLYTFIFFFALTAMISAQTQIYLNIDQRAGDETLVEAESFTTSAGYDLNFTRLQYYISEIFIIHDGGQETKLEGMYILANALEDTNYDLGQVDLTRVEGIRFHIGVDEENNHADPALWPIGHPLAPSFPTMHWGWAAGYRFAAIEGKAGRGLAFIYQVHALGDQHYGAVELDVEPRVEGNETHIDLKADYLRLFDGLDVSFGLIEHSDAPKAAQLLTNLKENVFTSAATTSSKDQIFDGVFEVMGNPVSNNITVRYDLQGTHTYNIELFSAVGQTLFSQDVQESGIMTIDQAAKGQMYLVLRSNNEVLKTISLLGQ